MTPEQAIDVIKRACYAFVGNRQDHETIEQALQVIQEKLTPTPQPDTPAK